MHSRHVLFVVLVLSLSACAATNRPATPWKIELTTSGGITGRGNGSITVDSGGAIAVTSIDRKQCSFAATEKELGELTAVLRDARPETWKESYTPANPCCDRIEYTLHYDEGGKTTSTTWIDDPLPMPRDLTNVIEAVRSLMRANIERCRAQ